ncbi:M3 family peptidase, partial [bacterium]|nr:M3 family peptidase [bacterium]
MTSDNPLLIEWNTPFGIAPFNLISPEHFKPAVEEAIAIARNEIDQIVSDPTEPDFTNTVEALEKAGSLLNRITPVLFNLNSSDTTPGLQEAARDVSPMLTNFSNDITLNPVLFKKVRSVWERRQSLVNEPEQLILLDRRYKSFVRGGAGLADDEKERFRAITVELSTLSLKFEENVLAETNDFTLHLTSAEDISGLPEGIREAAAALAHEKGMEGWLFTLHAPSFVPFMQYA